MAETDNAENSTQKAQSQDLDFIVKTFDKWQSIIASLMKERSTLMEKNKILTSNKDKLSVKNNELEQKVNNLHGTLDGHHNKLNIVCDLEDQIRSLKKSIETKEQEVANLKSTMIAQTDEHADILQNVDQKHKQEVKKLRADLQQEAEEVIQNLQSQLDKEKGEIQELQDKIQQQERDKQAEIAMLTMDYENKLAQLKHKTSAATLQQGGAANQEIYRKKLQHLKGEHEQEVGLLKKTITELQQKLISQQTDKTEFVTSKKRKN